MTKIIISGALGAMGRKIYNIASVDPELEVLCGVDINSAPYPLPLYSDFSLVSGQADVIIDFSSPKALTSLLKYATATNTPSVICTTGLTKEQLNEITEASEKVAIFKSANMSLGINVLKTLAKKAAEILDGFDIEIVEKHHNKKLDAPSGTALYLADTIKEAKFGLENKYGRYGKTAKREAYEIGIHAVRGGTIAGEHEIGFYGEGERVTLSHSAESKEVFAKGAVAAAKFIAGLPPKMYDMDDLIKF